AYRATLPNDWMLAPFARYEVFNTGSSYASIGAGLTPESLDDQKVFTAGFNLDIAQGVVFKIDYLHFNSDEGDDRVDLGLGYQVWPGAQRGAPTGLAGIGAAGGGGGGPARRARRGGHLPRRGSGAARTVSAGR